jgi:hypothetical protein
MHERTERAIARLLFVFCCALPTVITLLMILVTWTPWYHHRQLESLTRELSSQTGLTVRIADFRRVSPAKWLLEDVRLFAPETDHEVARVREITWLAEGKRNAILLHQPELQASQLRHAWHLVHDRFLCRPARTSVPLQLSANDLTIHSAEGAVTLRDVDALVKPLAEAIQANIECLPAFRSSGSPVKVTIRRDRKPGELPRTQWTLESGDTPLPCSALSDWMPLMRKLGAEAEFTGLIHWEVDAHGRWTVDLGGSNFWHIDLSRLCEDMPHGLRAQTADLHLDRGFIDPGKTVNLAGSIRATRGYVDQSLLKSAADNLFLAVDPAVFEQQSGDVWFDLLAVHFRVSDASMELDGICGNERHGYERLPPGVALSANHQPLVETGGRAFAALRLTRVISPGHSELVPIANQTKGWMNLLIAPNRVDLPAGGLTPSGSIRKAARWSGGEPIRQQ